jgi:hypothetical protein
VMLCLRCLETSVSDVSTHHTSSPEGIRTPHLFLERRGVRFLERAT